MKTTALAAALLAMSAVAASAQGTKPAAKRASRANTEVPATPARPSAAPVLIKNATVLTVTKGTLKNTDLLLQNGKIAQIGKNLSRAGRCAGHRRHGQVRHARHHRSALAHDGGRA